MRCEDFPCCGHELGCCPRRNSNGEQTETVVILVGVVLHEDYDYPEYDEDFSRPEYDDPLAYRDEF